MNDLSPRRRLDSWKEVARHLRRNVRTVSRWERERGLPVHRVPGGRSRTIYAFTDELDAWMANTGDLPSDVDAAANNGREEPSGAARWPILSAAVAIAVLAVTGWSIAALWPDTYDLASAIVDADSISALATDGRVVWRYSPDTALLNLHEGRIWSAVGALDSDAGDDLVVAGTAGWEAPEGLLAFSNAGRLLWTQKLDDQFRFGSETFAPPWRTTDVLFYASGGASRVAWMVHHHAWWPSMIVTFDDRGNALDRFVHPGWLTAMRVSADGKTILAAGLNRALASPVLMAIDVTKPGGTVPQSVAVPLQPCANCPPGRPLRYAALPRPELVVATDLPVFTPAGAPKLLVLPGGGVEIRVLYEPKDAPRSEAIYEFDRELQLTRARLSDQYWAWHRQMEQAGRIDHPDAACPDRQGLRANWISQ